MISITKRTHHRPRVFQSVIGLSALWIWLLCVGGSASAQMALVADRLIDGRRDNVIEDAAVLVHGDQIVAVGDRSIIPLGTEIINLGDVTLMPGMINAHEHVLIHAADYQEAHLQTSSAYKTLMALAGVQELLLAGWTSIRVPGDADVHYGGQDLRRVIDSGVFVGPRLTGAAHYISITGGGGDINYLSAEQSVRPDGLVVDGPDEIRKAVRTEIKYGSDWIKLMVSGSFQAVGDNPHHVTLAPEELRAAMEEAKRLGVPVAAHAHSALSIRQAIEAGVRSIEHGTYIDEDTMDMMATHGTYLVPTIYVGDYYYDSDKLRSQEKNDDYYVNERSQFLSTIGTAHKKGVKIVVGSDLGTIEPPSHVYAREFAVLVEAGLSPMEAIKAGTSVAAELLMWDDRIGTIEEGKLADIIAVPGNPLEDIRQLEKVSMVMIGGRIVKRPGAEPVLADFIVQP